MIRLTSNNGVLHYVAAGNIVRVTEASLSTAWHGTRSIVHLSDGAILDVTQTPADINAAVEAEYERMRCPGAPTPTMMG